MTSLRKRRAKIYCLQLVTLRRRAIGLLEDQMWDQMPAVGREFGSPDFERLMEEDYRLGRGVFDPTVRQAFQTRNKRLAGLDPPEDFQPQPSTPA
jgi:hypothetical protein